MARRALVTGGAGFIGSRLVRTLLAADWQVCVVDDFSVGREADLAFAGETVPRVAADISVTGAVDRAITAWQPDVVFHLAALHFIPHCERDPARAIEINVLGTQRVIDAVAGRTGCRLIFASTGDVYASAAQPHNETSPLAPGSLYGITKLTGEHLVRHAAARGAACRIARLFNVFGPGDRTPHVLPDIVRGLAERGAIDIGRLEPVRDYVYVDDVAAALLRLAEYDGEERLFNIGSGEGRSVQQLVDAVLAAHGATAAVRTDPAKVRPIERPVLVADIGRATRVLGWSPQTAFADGIANTLTAAARLSPVPMTDGPVNR
jgi:UDP-glucose 4-epimerase